MNKSESVSKNKKRLFISIFISTCLHASAFATYQYATKNKNADISFSDSFDTGSAFSLAFAQISSSDTNMDFSASDGIISDEISNIESMESPEVLEALEEEVVEEIEPIEAIEEDEVVEIAEPIEAIEEYEVVEIVEVTEVIEAIEEIADEPVIIEEKPKKEKPKKEIKEKPKEVKKQKPKETKKEVKKHENNHNKNQKSSKKSTASSKTTLVKGSNDTSVAGGNRASGTGKGGGGTNINGLIYKAILKHKTYPRKARAMGVQGRVIVSFKLKDRNNFENLSVTKSSGAKVLDDHALAIINKAKVDFPIEAVGTQITVPINFNLKD